MSQSSLRQVVADRHSRSLIGRLVREQLRPQRGRVALAVLFMLLGALATAALARQMEPLLDLAFIDNDAAELHIIAATVLLIFVVRGAAAYGQAVTLNAIGQRIVAGLQRQLFAALMRADLAFFHANAPGRLISRLTYDATLLRAAMSTTLVGIGRDSLTLLFLAALMIWQDWLLACITLTIIPLAILPVRRVGRRVRRVSGGTQAEMAAFTTLLDETFQGIRQVKAHGMEHQEEGRAGAAIEALYALNCRAGRARAINYPILEILCGVSAVAVLLYGGHMVMSGVKQPGAFFSFITALLLAYEPLKRLANLNNELQAGLAAAERVFALLDMRPAITDRAGARPLEVAGGAIEFSDVRFAYDAAAGDRALDGVSLTVPAGATVALVGPSGAGKSTVLSLIPRFFDVGAGAIAIDGQDIREVTVASLRAAIALVSQDVILFDDTVRANILYGRPGASEAELLAAARGADAHDFIERLPRRYDTPVGPRGSNLSGGQRQRIAIARAMLRDAPILLLDEATSALDSESERQVQEALARLKRGRTTVVIAHRLSTVLSADLIYVLCDGTVVESGRHGELLAAGGVYARFHALQFVGDVAASADEPPSPRRVRA